MQVQGQLLARRSGAASRAEICDGGNQLESAADMSKPPVVVISGGATDIGRTIAMRFAAEGYQVHVCDVDAAAVARFREDNPQAGATQTDVSRVEQVDAFFDEVAQRHGRLDVLVNNVGIAGPMRALFTACKWAPIGFTKTLAMELGTFGIRVNAICPGSGQGPRIDGVIERDAAKRGRTPEEIRAVYARQSSMRLFVTADDVANLAFFLASAQGATISGQAIGFDGHTESLSNWLD